MVPVVFHTVCVLHIMQRCIIKQQDDYTDLPPFTGSLRFRCLCRPHLRGSEVIEEIEHALTKWSKYGLDMPRAVRLELCKVYAYH